MSTAFDHKTEPQGLHVAIIMDGNGRWANARSLPRVAGHRAGAEALRPIVEAAPQLGIKTLTVYAFSSDNWQRPGPEVKALMRLFHAYLLSEAKRCLANGVRLNIIGRRDRFQPALREVMERVEAATVQGQTLHLRVALDYSSRDAILRAACKVNGAKEISRERFACLLAEVDHAGVTAPDVDLLIRTGGEKRLSDFLLWECAYAELFFTKRMWPDFRPADLEAAIKEFHLRERRFGRIPQNGVQVHYEDTEKAALSGTLQSMIYE
ncbi:di-trans,poly-cis-decaprenylcistransferase [candidate division KSB1 bacterium]|nr:di-trans,poly-cis-decaprenylcistransferase [candidate division KSB1 bacterium]